MRTKTLPQVRTGMWWATVGYGALIVVAAAYALYQGNVVRVNSEFSGLPLMMLGLPWSILFRDPKILESTFNNSVLVCSAYAAANALALVALRYVLGGDLRR
jgi:hypothetical protein